MGALQMEKTNIEKITSELHKAYDLINRHFFESKLPTIAITIQSESRRQLSMGWCTRKEIWSDKEGKIKMYEINLTPEFLDLDFYETMDTLMHEMVHLYNNIHGVQDVSRSGTYHNSKFRDESIKRGFEYEDDKPDKKYGWSFSRLSEDTKRKIDTLDINKNTFSIARKTPGHYLTQEEQSSETNDEESKNKPKSFKWVCSSCNAILRTTKEDMNIVCGDCNVKFEIE